MAYCPHSGRTVNDGDEFCANCARKIFLNLGNRETGRLPADRWSICPRCHGSGLISSPDTEITARIICDFAGCKNGRIWQ